MRRFFVFTVAQVAILVCVLGQEITLPQKPGSLRFAVIGDSGTGGREQYDVANKLIGSRSRFPYEFVIMLGDNMYGGENPKDFQKKFERPYKPLLDAGIKFYASLGNHDEPTQSRYRFFNMNGERFYTFKPKAGIRFFALDSNYMDPDQLQWLRKELDASGSDWKICFFHHPLYSSGQKHGSDVELREILEPVFVQHGVDLVLAGHEHFYERLKPQKGIHYFISGGAGKLRRENVAAGTGLTAKAFDTDNHFMLMEIAGDDLYYQAISRNGKTFDSGVLRRREVVAKAKSR